MMNLHALRIFSIVAAMKSVTKASEHLSVSQPAVTAQIRNLEKETELRLLENAGRGIRLTKQGEFLFKYAEVLFDYEREIEQKIVQLKKGKFEELRISSTYLPSNFLLPIWLANFKKEYPSVKVNLYSGNAKEVTENLLHHRSDIAFIVKEEWDEPEITRHHLLDIDFWFIVPVGHPYFGKEISLHRLMKEPFIMREEGSSTRDILFSLCKIHRVPEPHIGLEFHGLTETIRSVIAGYGTTLVPALSVMDYLERGEIGRVKVKGIEVKRPIHICTRKSDKELSNHAADFISIIKSKYITSNHI